MKGRVGILSSARHAVVVAIAFALLLGTTGAGPASSFHANVDPALHAGDLALIQVRHGTAWTVATELTASGATDVLSLDSIDVVTARITTDSLAKIASEPAVRTATTDTGVAATSGPKDKFGKELDEDDDGTEVISPGPLAINASQAWERSTGTGVVVALLDSGVAEHRDLTRKVLTRVNFVNDNTPLLDPAGHGTHLAGVIAGNGRDFKGVAPSAKLVSLRVLDAKGNGQLKDVLRAFDWLLKNRRAYNVRVANVSFGAPEARSYHDDLLSAVAESAHFAGITVVVAAGNNGPGARTLTTPGSDPFVITAGSFDDQGTIPGGDDRESSFSSRGPSFDGFAKPDVLAPGRRVLSLRAKGATIAIANRLAKDDTEGQYIRMTGTSVSAAMVSGVAALTLAAHPDYTPTKVKGAIAASGRAVSGSITPAVDAAKALSAMKDVNVKLAPSKLLLKRLTELGVGGSGTTWEGVSWEGVSWEGVSWDAVTWETVSWEGVIWEAVSWE